MPISNSDNGAHKIHKNTRTHTFTYNPLLLLIVSRCARESQSTHSWSVNFISVPAVQFFSVLNYSIFPNSFKFMLRYGDAPLTYCSTTVLYLRTCNLIKAVSFEVAFSTKLYTVHWVPNKTHKHTHRAIMKYKVRELVPSYFMKRSSNVELTIENATRITGMGHIKHDLKYAHRRILL